MHKVLNVKHRIVRRTDAERAPLATFDIVDLGDEDNNILNKTSNKSLKQEGTASKKEFLDIRLCDAGIQKAGTIGGNHSKKALSQAGGEGKEEKAADPPTESKDNCHSFADDAKCETSLSTEEKRSDDKEGNKRDECEEISKSYITESKESPDDLKKSPAVQQLASVNLTRQGTLGRVSIPIKKQSSVSSSSSSEACNDSHFTFTTSRPSIAHLDSAEGGYDTPDSFSHKGSVSNLVPDNIDPKQILSPSKRKAYEKRLERLKVTTSPIARPRSNAPINVVTLDEYANISSPEHSPLSHSLLQDKLKITLPCDEFNRNPKVSNAKRKDSDDTCFEFSEEILFRCTKSALVVDEDGQLPISPRRVLIPPTITPTNSPKLSSSPRLSTESTGDNNPTHSGPKLIYMKEDDPAHRFFGLTFDESGNDNWADFPDSSVNVEKADTECLEKEEILSNVCEQDQSDSLNISTKLQESENLDSCKDDNSVESSHLGKADIYFVGVLDKNDSDLNVKKVSPSSKGDILEESTSSNTFEESISPITFEKSNSCVTVEKTHVVKEVLVYETIRSQVENIDGNNLFDKTKLNSTDNSVIDQTQELIKEEGSANNESGDGVLIHLSNSLSECEKPVSFLEGESGTDTKGEISILNYSGVSTNPFSLLDASTNLDEASVVVPIPVSTPGVIQLQATTSNINANTNTHSSLSLNPFLQEVLPSSEVFDTSDKDRLTESCSGNVELPNVPSASQESQRPFIDLNLSNNKSSSASSDLINFSSLDLDLPPSQ